MPTPFQCFPISILLDISHTKRCKRTHDLLLGDIAEILGYDRANKTTA